jgi:hypothetical protein
MTFKKILFGEEAMLALKKSKGERVVDGRMIAIEHDGRKVWAFVPYNRKPRQKPLVMTLRDLVNGWIKMGRKHIGVYSAVSSKLSPEEAVAVLKRDICEGLDQVLEDGTIEEMKDFFNLMGNKA